MLQSTRLVRTLTVPLILLLILGILVAGTAGAQAPAGTASLETPEGDLLELAPDNEPRTDVVYEAESGAAAAHVQYLFVSASSFVPIDDDMTYEYYSGCIYRTGGYRYTDYSLQLPQGAVVTALRLLYYDTDAVNDAGAYLNHCTHTGPCVLTNHVESSGTPGYSNDEAVVSYTVDNQSESLSLRLDYGSGVDNTLRLCGVRVQYEYDPFSAVFLPTVTR